MSPTKNINSYENPYWGLSRGPLHSLVFIAPMLIAYEAYVFFHGVDNLARSELQSLLSSVNPAITHFSAILIAAVLLIWHWLTGKSWKIRFEAIPMMALEAALLAVPLLCAGLLSEKLAAASIAKVQGNFGISSVLFARIGAGIYEEFIFRFVAFNLLGLLFNDMIKMKKDYSVPIILLFTSILFAWRHFPGEAMIVFPKFLFYAICGLYLGSIYLLRGFGLSVGAHIFYNIYVTLIEFA